jgi:polysaccharide biosynthesis transport protein
MSVQQSKTMNADSHAQNTGAFGPTGTVREEESLRGLVQILRKRKLIVIIAAITGFVLALAACMVMPNRFTSSATVLMNKEGTAGLNLGAMSGMASVLGGGDDVKTDLATHEQLLASDSTILETVKELRLQDHGPYRNKTSLIPWNKQSRSETGASFEDSPAARDKILRTFKKHLAVRSVEDTRLISVTFSDEDPDVAALVANKLIAVYMRKYLETRFQATAAASDWLSSQIGDLKHQAEESRTKLADYERKTGLSSLMMNTSPGGNGASSISSGAHIPQVDTLIALNSTLTAAQADRIAKEAIYKLTQSESPEVVLGLGSSSLASVGGGSSAIGSGLGLLQNLRQQEAPLKIAYAEAASKYGANNPHLAELQGQIAALDSQMRNEMERIRQRAQNDFRLAQQNEASIRQEFTKQEAVVGQLNDATTQLEILAGEAASSQALYEGLYTKLQEANVDAGVKATNLLLVDPALRSARPAEPNWPVLLVAGFGIGLLCGLAGAFLWENLDDKITNTDQIEQISVYPVLSGIPRVALGDKSQQEASGNQRKRPTMDPVSLIQTPKSTFSEAFRTLRTAIELSTAGAPPQILLVTSALGGEGKSTISSHLAVSFVQQGKRVLLIDSDMRKPIQHAVFGVVRRPGLSDVLAGTAPFEQCVKVLEEVPGLSLLTAGTTPPNPAELLGSARMAALLAEQRKNYDLILIDSPPALFVTDALILSGGVDGTLVVVSAGKTTKPAIVRISRLLGQTEGRKLGFVLNTIDVNSAEYYYSYGYYGKHNYYDQEGN